MNRAEQLVSALLETESIQEMDTYAATVYALLGAGALAEFYQLWKYPAQRQRLKDNWHLLKNDAKALWNFIQGNRS